MYGHHNSNLPRLQACGGVSQGPLRQRPGRGQSPKVSMWWAEGGRPQVEWAREVGRRPESCR